MKAERRVVLTRDDFDATEQRFWSKVLVNEETGCQEWQAARTSSGYGSFFVRREPGRRSAVIVTAHVYAWESKHGPVPDGLQLDHTCRNRRCVWDVHLEPVTPKVNVNRGMSPNVTTKLSGICQRGHIQDFVKCNGGKGLRCRPCRNMHVHKSDKKRRAFDKRLVAEARRQIAAERWAQKLEEKWGPRHIQAEVG